MRSKTLCIVGTGYVGLCTAVAFAKKQYNTICVDIDRAKVNLINRGKPPFFEKNLPQILKEVVSQKKLFATTSYKNAIEKSSVIFLCLPTPPRKNGTADLSFMKEAVESIGITLRPAIYRTIVVKSTVPPGTTESVIIPALQKYSGLKAGGEFGVCVNPEFLREGSALQDCLKPDRIIIGAFDNKSRDTILQLYKKYRCPKVVVDIRTAETIKYATNAFLATKISFANELANICEKLSVDVYEVVDAVALDRRISRAFLDAGAGFGGSCLPKDLKAFIKNASQKGYEPQLLNAVLAVNEYQPLHVVEHVENVCGSLKNKKIALLGVTFKPGTDDIRGTRALPIVKQLLEKNAKVFVYDPCFAAVSNFERLVRHSNLKTVKKLSEAIANADCCIIQTAWAEFKKLKPSFFKKLCCFKIVDCRRVYKPMEFINAGLQYRGIGWGGR